MSARLPNVTFVDRGAGGAGPLWIRWRHPHYRTTLSSFVHRGAHATLRTFADNRDCKPRLFKVWPGPGAVLEDGGAAERRQKMELFVLRTVEHRLLPRLECVLDGEMFVAAVTAFVPGGDLEQRCPNLPLRRLTAAEAQFYASELLLALRYLHARGIFHRDLRPGHLLLRQDGHLLVVDFGAALVLGPDAPEPLSVVPSSHYSSPELLERYLHVLEASHGLSGEPEANTPPRGGPSPSRSPLRAFRDIFRSCTIPRIRSDDPPAAQGVTVDLRDSDRPAGRTEASPSPQTSPQAVDPSDPRRHSAEMTFMADYWSVGCVLAFFLTGRSPFHDSPDRSRALLAAMLNPDHCAGLKIADEAAADLIAGLLRPELKARLGYFGDLQAITGHRFFRGIDWSDEKNLLRRLPPFSQSYVAIRERLRARRPEKNRLLVPRDPPEELFDPCQPPPPPSPTASGKSLERISTAAEKAEKMDQNRETESGSIRGNPNERLRQLLLQHQKSCSESEPEEEFEEMDIGLSYSQHSLARPDPTEVAGTLWRPNSDPNVSQAGRVVERLRFSKSEEEVRSPAYAAAVGDLVEFWSDLRPNSGRGMRSVFDYPEVECRVGGGPWEPTMVRLFEGSSLSPRDPNDNESEELQTNEADPARLVKDEDESFAVVKETAVHLRDLELSGPDAGRRLRRIKSCTDLQKF